MSFIVYKETADLYRLVTDADDVDLEGYTPLYRGLKLNIQPAGLEYVATMPDGALGKYYKAFTTYSGCQIGMRIATSGTPTISGMLYEVAGVENFRGPLGRTFELLLRKSTN